MFNKFISKIKPYGVSFSRNKVHSKNVLKLDWNEATIPPAKEVSDAIVTFLSKDNHLNWYPDLSSKKLLASLSAYTGISQGNILVTNGSDQAHELICNAILNEGDLVFVPTPTYTNFFIWPQIRGAKVVFYHTGVAEIDYNAMINEISHGFSLIYLVTPYIHAIPQDIIIRILEKKIPTIIDEAYFEFYSTSFVSLIKKFDNLIITRSFSKALSFAGMRLGYICASKRIMSELRKIHNFKSVNVLAQIGGVGILKNKEYFNSYITQVKKSVTLLTSALDDDFNCIACPAGFVLLKHKKWSASTLVKKLEKKNVFVRDLSNKGVPGYIRCSVGTVDQTNELIKRIKSLK